MSAADHANIDPNIVAALYLEHGEELRRFLLGILRDAQLANDVLQTSLAKMIERGHHVQEASHKAWLFRVAYNEAMAIRRREAVGAKATQQAAWLKDSAGKPSDDPVIRFETVEAVKAAMDRLPAEQRQVVVMRIYEDKTFAVIANELNIPLGTALARMRAALAKLRKHLAD